MPKFVDFVDIVGESQTSMFGEIWISIGLYIYMYMQTLAEPKNVISMKLQFSLNPQKWYESTIYELKLKWFKPPTIHICHLYREIKFYEQQ